MIRSLIESFKRPSSNWVFLMSSLGSRERAKLLRAHVRIICSLNGIKLIGHSKGYAAREERTVWIRTVKSDRTYAEAMHEIGHILGPWQKSSVLAEECGAWVWARKNALQWNDAMERHMVTCLGTYVTVANDNGTKLPGAGHPAWSTLRRAGAVARKPKKSAEAKRTQKVASATKRKKKS
jgi:hypothetical protein